jgi:hypothetical protein
MLHPLPVHSWETTTPPRDLRTEGVGAVDYEAAQTLFGANRAAEMRDWYFIAEQPASAPHLAHPEGCAALTHVF